MEWISVKDRLPNESIYDYLLFSDGEVVYCGQYYDSNSYDGEPKFKSKTIGHISHDSEVTEWMPLPLPKGKEKTELVSEFRSSAPVRFIIKSDAENSDCSMVYCEETNEIKIEWGKKFCENGWEIDFKKDCT